MTFSLDAISDSIMQGHTTVSDDMVRIVIHNNTGDPILIAELYFDDKPQSITAVLRVGATLSFQFSGVINFGWQATDQIDWRLDIESRTLHLRRK
jgi:hypothetical protein